MDAISQTIFSSAFSCENVWIPIKNSLKLVPKGLIINIPALVQIMAWRRSGDKPLSEPMMASLPTHICVARPQWVKVAYICELLVRSTFIYAWQCCTMFYWVACMQLHQCVFSWDCIAIGDCKICFCKSSLVSIMAFCRSFVWSIADQFDWKMNRLLGMISYCVPQITILIDGSITLVYDENSRYRGKHFYSYPMELVWRHGHSPNAVTAYINAW